jgi:hypothetical protein
MRITESIVKKSTKPLKTTKLKRKTGAYLFLGEGTNIISNYQCHTARALGIQDVQLHIVQINYAKQGRIRGG